MAEFSVKPELLQDDAECLRRVSNDVKAIKRELGHVENTLDGMIGFNKSKSSLKNIHTQLELESGKIINISIALNNIGEIYIKTENKVLGNDYGLGADLHVIIEMLEDVEPVLAYVDDVEEIFWDSYLKALKQIYGGTFDFIADHADEALDYYWTALKQIYGGDFVEDSNLLGTWGSILLGFVPFFGTVADARDLVADIIHLIDDGQETKEWVALGFTLVAFIPSAGDFLKHSDEISDLLKGLTHSDEIADIVGGLMKNGSDVINNRLITDIRDYLKNDNIIPVWNKIFSNENVSDLLKEPLDVIKQSPEAKKFFNDIVDGTIKTNLKNISCERAEYLSNFDWEQLQQETGISQWYDDSFVSAIL